MRNIMFFGDSNTFGTDPLGGRHPYEIRFTGRLQKALGSDFRIIEEGLGGRTTVYEDAVEDGRCGKTALPICLGTHKPLDLIVVMLGTNDLKEQFHVAYGDVRNAMEKLLHIIDTYQFAPHYPTPQVLVVAPIHIGEGIVESMYDNFAHDAARKSKWFADAQRVAAQKYGAHFLDAALYARPSTEDQLHMGADGHESMAKVLDAKIRSILG